MFREPDLFAAQRLKGPAGAPRRRVRADRRGRLIKRIPGKHRSIRALVGPESLPELKSTGSNRQDHCDETLDPKSPPAFRPRPRPAPDLITSRALQPDQPHGAAAVGVHPLAGVVNSMARCVTRTGTADTASFQFRPGKPIACRGHRPYWQISAQIIHSRPYASICQKVWIPRSSVSLQTRRQIINDDIGFDFFPSCSLNRNAGRRIWPFDLHRRGFRSNRLHWEHANGRRILDSHDFESFDCLPPDLKVNTGRNNTAPKKPGQSLYRRPRCSRRFTNVTWCQPNRFPNSPGNLRSAQRHATEPNEQSPAPSFRQLRTAAGQLCLD